MNASLSRLIDDLGEEGDDDDKKEEVIMDGDNGDDDNDEENEEDGDDDDDGDDDGDEGDEVCVVAVGGSHRCIVRRMRWRDVFWERTILLALSWRRSAILRRKEGVWDLVRAAEFNIHDFNGRNLTEEEEEVEEEFGE